jgi:hypothetical protein
MLSFVFSFFLYARLADIATLLFLLIKIIATLSAFDFVQLVITPRITGIVTN